MRKSSPINYRETLKFNLWVKHFTDRSNKETFGNSTKSALQAYNTKNYNSASVIGHENLRKLKNLSSMIADLEGFGFGERIRIAISKALKGSYDDWHKLLIQLGDFEPDNRIGMAVQNNFNFGSIGEELAKASKERGLLA